MNSQFEIDSNPYRRDHTSRYYIFRELSDDETEYLHKDGTIHLSTGNGVTGEYPGYYATREEAQEVLNKYNIGLKLQK